MATGTVLAVLLYKADGSPPISGTCDTGLCGDPDRASAYYSNHVTSRL
jgi:hypothetical protein